MKYFCKVRLESGKDQETTLDKAVKLIFSHYKGSNWKLGGNLAKDPVTLKSVKGNVLSAIIALLKQVPELTQVFSLTVDGKPVGAAESISMPV